MSRISHARFECTSHALVGALLQESTHAERREGVESGRGVTAFVSEASHLSSKGRFERAYLLGELEHVEHTMKDGERILSGARLKRPNSTHHLPRNHQCVGLTELQLAFDLLGRRGLVQPDAVRKELAKAVPFFGALAPETRVALELVGERGA